MCFAEAIPGDTNDMRKHGFPAKYCKERAMERLLQPEGPEDLKFFYLAENEDNCLRARKFRCR